MKEASGGEANRAKERHFLRHTCVPLTPSVSCDPSVANGDGILTGEK